MPQVPAYRQFAPSKALASYVACYWTITPDASGRDTPARRVRVLPDCCMDAVFDLSGGLSGPGGARSSLSGEISGSGGAGCSKSSAFIVGASLASMVIPLPHTLRAVGVTFLPGGATPFFGGPSGFPVGSPRQELAG
jgi:hypothetical protein